MTNMREDRIVKKSKKGHKPNLISEIGIEDVLIAAGILAFVSFSFGRYVEHKQMNKPETKMEQSSGDVVEGTDYQSAYEQVMRSLNDDQIQEERRQADEADRMRSQQELEQINAYNESRNQKQVESFWKYQEEEKNGMGR